MHRAGHGGGNKARQLEFYLGQAKAEGADTIIITGAVQSNFTRMAAAAARMEGMGIHIQLEERVANPSVAYHRSGNLLLSRILGATLHSYPQGEDEAGADQALEGIADKLRAAGKRPYVIHLGQTHPPLGALGYVVAAREVCQQMAASAQTLRIRARCQLIADLLKMENPVLPADILLNDTALAPGYGKINPPMMEAIALTAQKEGILLDPVYTGKTMAGFIARARQVKTGQALLFIHTGGQPALFGYESDLAPLLSDSPFDN